MRNKAANDELIVYLTQLTSGLLVSISIDFRVVGSRRLFSYDRSIIGEFCGVALTVDEPRECPLSQGKQIVVRTVRHRAASNKCLEVITR